MRALDAEDDGHFRTRIELAREVVARFAEVRVAEGDRVGLVVFGDTAFTQCPLTRDGALLAASLGRVEAGMAGEATALGDALALAVKRVLGDADAQRPNAPGRPLAGRLVVLLTDGRSNAGSVPSEVAAALAAHHGVRVHTVGIGGEGEVAMAGGAPDARDLERQRHDLDATTLQQIASSTRGRAFQALSSGDLEAVYREIDQLERVEREAPPRLTGAPVPEPFLALAALAVGLELLGTRALNRRLP
jgi:Ca-activated chloride channel family protein